MSRQSKHAKYIFCFLSRRPRRHVVRRWPCYCCSSLLCSGKEPRDNNEAFSALLLQSSEPPEYLKKTAAKKRKKLLQVRFSFYSSKKYTPSTCRQNKKPQVQQPGTTFSNFSDELRLQRGHRNCYHLGALTGVHQRIRSCLARYWINGKKSELDQNKGLSYRNNQR